ncbi:MAG: DNA polymerase III subunit delta [Bacteroidia bacterium]|nr:DNA polymerase III subunit delta [Bacteroidia bacterium]
MTFESVLADLKKGKYLPLYLLHGAEPFFIDRIAEQMEQSVLQEHEKEFNQTVVYGKDTDVLSLISMAKRYPMMAERQVIIVREAQEIRNLFKTDDTEDTKNPLLDYVMAPQKSTVLVICYKYKTADSRTKLVKAFAKNGVVFKSDKLYDNQLPGWISNYAASEGVKIDQQSCILLAEHLGNDLSRIANEIDKLLLHAGKTKIINADMIEKYVGISREYNVFELQSALGVKNVLKVNRIINYFAANEKDNPMVMVVALLYSYFVKVMKCHTAIAKDQAALASLLGVNPFFVKDYTTAARNYPFEKLKTIFNELSEYDLRSKGVNNESAESSALMKELVFKILH